MMERACVKSTYTKILYFKLSWIDRKVLEVLSLLKEGKAKRIVGAGKLKVGYGTDIGGACTQT